MANPVLEKCPLRVPAALSAEEFQPIRRHAVLDGCKWDPQVGDVPTLAAFPLVMSRATWDTLARWAEQLSEEAAGAERELWESSRLVPHLGIPRSIERVLRGDPTPAAARFVRYDFHWTTAGWRISEMNSDVPGGFFEASCFTARMADLYPPSRPAGDPGAILVDALLSTGDIFALLCDFVYMEDLQVISYVGRLLRRHGAKAFLASPRHITWKAGRALSSGPSWRGYVDAIYRFYPGDWLARFPRSPGWSHFFNGGRTPVANPGYALLTESKRFPLVWDSLRTSLPTWRRLMPETRDPRDVSWDNDEWVLKQAFSDTGDDVAMRSVVSRAIWRKASGALRRRPQRWAVQRKFEAVPLDTPLGKMYPCLGVYTINGRSAGAYGRMTPAPLTDANAIDVAVLVE